MVNSERDWYTRPRRVPTETTGHPPLSLIFNQEPWMGEGICAQTDPEAFFPEKGGSVREGKKVCRTCPVQRECLIFALESDQSHGIWGGHTARERRKLQRRTPRSADQ